MSSVFDFPHESIREHINSLSVKIGNRLAGTAGEMKAAKYIAARFAEYGLRNVHIERFPCVSWTCRKATFSVKGRKWRNIPCLPLAHTRSTSGRVEAELVYLEKGTAGDFAGRNLKGKIGLLFGGFGDKPDKYVRLLESGLAAVVLVDDRLPFDWPVAMGMSRYWKRLGRQTGITISYKDAWEIVKSRTGLARIEIDARTRNTQSTNVVGEVKGRQAGQMIAVCAHHDSVYGNVGAEDDGSGVTCVLELARVFGRTKPRRTIRFMTFGTEEQLSEGSKHYVLRHRREMKKFVFCLNTDSVGCWMGESQVFVAGTRALEKFAEESAGQAGFSASVTRDISPFSDQFPFNMFGVPSLWFHRQNCPGGRWYHHSKHDTPAVLSDEVMAATLRAEAVVLDRVANAGRLPFPREIPAGQRGVIERYKRDLYGLGDVKTSC